MQSIIKQEFSEHIKVTVETIKSIGKPIEIAAKICIDSLKKGGKILIFGNGGSAADAQHIAAEFISKFKKDYNGKAKELLKGKTDKSSEYNLSTKRFRYLEIDDYLKCYKLKRKDKRLFDIGTMLEEEYLKKQEQYKNSKKLSGNINRN